MTTKTILTRPLDGFTCPALDPLVAEISWTAWHLARLARPRGDERSMAAVRGIFLSLAETMWQPGRVSMLSEAVVTGDGSLRFALAVGVMGEPQSTAREAEVVSAVVESTLNGPGIPYGIERTDPTSLLGPEEVSLRHSVVIRQPYVSVEGTPDGPDIDVLARMNPTLNPWNRVATLLSALGAPARVRVTLMPTEVTVADRLWLREATAVASRFSELSKEDPTRHFQAERALATLVDLSASFATPVFCCEIAVSSPEPLPALWTRAVASCFTSDTDVLRQGTHSVVAAQQHILGGFDIEPAPPLLTVGHRVGLPTRGGVMERDLRDLVSLFESPLGWPTPSGQPLPGIAMGTARRIPVPDALTRGRPIGRGLRGAPVRIPPTALARHTLLVGATGTGKSTVLAARALDDLRAGRPFLLVDCHGQTADRVIAHADRLSRPVVVVDPLDPKTERVAVLPRLETGQRNVASVERSVAHLCDAVASRFHDQDWTGPRWHHLARALFIVAAANGAELAEAVSWINDRWVLEFAADHPAVRPEAAAALAGLHGHSDAAVLRDWISCKFDALVTTTARCVLAPAGHGLALGDALATGTPVVVNLAAFPLTDAAMLGHVFLAGVLDAATDGQFDPRRPVDAYVDEAHRFPMFSMERILNEGRKFGLSLTVATQSLHQFEPAMRDAAMAAAVKIAFRQSPDSAGNLALLMGVDAADLVDVPDLSAFVKVTGQNACSVDVRPYGRLPVTRDKVPPDALQAPPMTRLVADDVPELSPTEQTRFLLDPDTSDPG